MRWAFAKSGALAASTASALFAPALACTLPTAAGTRLGEGHAALAWRAEPAAIAIGKPFTLHVSICPGMRLVRVDATMPEHRHGMNYRPSLHPQKDGEGRWRADGLLWHMAGRWELRFDLVDAAGAPHTLRHAVELR
jgi:hypothetical protein